jgi:DNA-directed RNA polymerase specialized sigma subunit
MMEAIERRQNRSERAIAPLEERKRQIETVYQHVLCLDAKSKCVLLTLYYPKRTYEEAAEALEVDVSTIARRRNAAIASLVNRLKMSENESLHRKTGKAVRI